MCNRDRIFHKQPGNGFIQYFLFLILILALRSNAQSPSNRKNGESGGHPQRAVVTTSSKWIEESLKAHNYFRNLHGSPPLVLNSTLSEISQYYANYLLEANLLPGGHAKNTIYFNHNPETGRAGIGENLYYRQLSSSLDPIPAPDAVFLWYEEIKDYNFTSALVKATSYPKSKIGHLTQILWKSTTQMGTAYASKKLANNQLLIFVVANYYKGGNLLLNRERTLYFKNVPKPNLSDANVNAAIVKYIVKTWFKEQEPETMTPHPWQSSAMERHNYYRRLHGSQELRLNPHICKVTQLWVNYLLEHNLQIYNAYGTLNQIEENYKGKLCKFGETSLILLTYLKEPSPEHIVDLWYQQHKNFNFKEHQFEKRHKSDGFQRMVWNSTTEFCMSYATRQSEKGLYLTSVTANYYPSLPDDRPSYDFESKENIFPLVDGSTGDPNGASKYFVTFQVLCTLTLSMAYF